MSNSRHKIMKRTLATIEPLIPGKEGDSGRTAKDNIKFMNGVLWIIRTGCPWRNLPERFGKWNSVYRQFRRWAKKGVFAHIFRVLRGKTAFGRVMADGTICRAHQKAAGARKDLGHRPPVGPAAG